MKIIEMVSHGGVFVDAGNTLTTQPAFPQIVNTITWVAVLQIIVLPILIPVATGLLAKAHWSTLVKRLITGGLALVTSVGSAIVGAVSTNTPLDIGSIIFQWALTWGVAELVYYKLYTIPVTSQTDPDGNKATIASILAAKGNS